MDIDKAKEEENFIKENQTFFKKYKIIKKLAEGAFGDVYIGSNITTKDPVAIKVEPRKIAKPLLENEAYFLFQLRGVGIPEVLSFGRKKKYNILIEPLLGKSLFDIFNERRKHMNLADICLIAKQILDRIQWVHSKGFVHRDIKPDNFLIGRKDPNVIYLIDFGLSKKYKSDKTGKHLKFSFTGKLTGTVRFASANALRGGEQSRRDDLESIAYMIIFFMRGKLPWQGVTGTKKMERYLKIYKMKKNVTPEDLCKSLPNQMVQFTKYIKNLEFEQEPDYNYLRGLINSILKQRKANLDSLIFSWISYEDIKKIKDPINPATRKDSPQGRLYRKIENKLKRERNNSSDNDSGEKTYLSNQYNILSQDKEENYTSKDEAEVENNVYKTKAEKSKEGLNTLMVNFNKTLDENVNFEELEKKNIKIENMKKKNYTVNDAIDFKSEQKYANQNTDKDIRDKSEELRLSNQNERKMSLMQIDEKEEQNKNNNISSEEKEKNKNKDNLTNKEINKSVKNINNNSNDILLMNKSSQPQQKIIPIMQGKIKSNNIIDNKIKKNSNNNNNLINKNIEIPENSNINEIKNDKDIINNNDNIIKTEKEKNNNNRNNSNDNAKNIIQVQKKSSSPNKLIQKISKNNQDKKQKENKGTNQNKNNKLHNVKINKSNRLSKDNKELQIKTNNNNSNAQRINVQTQKLNIPRKLLTENDEGPLDNNRNKLIQINKNKIFKTEMGNLEIKTDSSKNNSQYIPNNIKLKKKVINNDRRRTPNNILNMKKNKHINDFIDNNRENKIRANISTYNNKIGILSNEFLPQNSDENLNNNNNIDLNEDKFDNKLINFNKENIKGKKLSNSLNLLKNDSDNLNNYYNNNIKANEYIMNSNIKSTKNNDEILNKDYINNNLINNYMPKGNNNNYSNKITNNDHLKNIEFNNNVNRNIRIVARNKNPNNIMNNNLNMNSKKIYTTFSDRIANSNLNNTDYKLHNININNNINNNIIINNNINNKYPQPSNSSLRSNSNNQYSGQNMLPNNFILTKRPSHNMNINSNKMMRSFNMYINSNPNSIQYIKRPSYNTKVNNMMNNMNINTNINTNTNINNNYNQMKEIIIATKRPSYNSNFSVSNFLNNTEPNKNSNQTRTTKIKKLTSNNMEQHKPLPGKNIEVVREPREIKSRGLLNNFAQDNFGQQFNKTFENDMLVNNIPLNQYSNNNINNLNNNMIFNKGNMTNNSSKIIELSEKRPNNQLFNVNSNNNTNMGNNINKIRIEKIPNYKTNYSNKIGNYQNPSNQFDNNMQYYGFNNY